MTVSNVRYLRYSGNIVFKLLILFNLLLIPAYAGVGAVISTIISFTATVFAVDIFYSRSRRNALHMLYAMATFYRLGGKVKWGV